VHEIRLHDTLTGRVLPLRPRTPGRVGIYACGPTVYGRVHIGNARPFVVFSLLKRFLAHEGYEVTLVANITDVNDKIYLAAAAAGIPSTQLAREMTEHYIADTDALALGRPDHEPLASETMAAIVELIERLIARGHAYVADGDVYFAVRSYDRYGARARRGPSASGIRSTSRCGRPPSPARTARGSRPGALGARVGTSSARRWPSSCSGSTSRFTAVGTT
jgi:cysteinyl-tRNA synthetase